MRPLVVALLSSVLLAGCPSEEKDLLHFEEGEEPTNLIFVSVDTLRRDAIGRWSGGGESDSPFIDSILEMGVALEHTQSCGNYTPPGVSCASSGRSTLSAGWFPFDGQPGFEVSEPPDDWLWLADALGSIGFQTSIVNANEHLNISGLDIYSSFQTVDAVGDAGGRTVTDRAIAAAEALDPDQPFFLHVHYVDPHTPYSPPSQYLDGLDDLTPVDPVYETFAFDGQLKQDWPFMSAAEKQAIKDRLNFLYAAEVRYWDNSVQNLFAGLDERGLLDDTLVVLWSDHGEAFGDRDYFVHKVHVYSDERAVLGGFWARNMEPNTYSKPARLADLVPTALDAMGLMDHEGLATFVSGFDGPVLGEEPEDSARTIFSFTERCTACSDAPALSARQGDHTLIYDWRGNVGLFDTVNDPQETNNLWDPTNSLSQSLWEVTWEKAQATATTLELSAPTPPAGVSR